MPLRNGDGAAPAIVLRMRRASLVFVLVSVTALAGCTAQGAGTSNFSLSPQAVGWYTGDVARFTLTISSSMLHSSPAFTIDRHFAIEEIQLVEKGLKFGGDYDTKSPDDVGFALERAGAANDTFVLDADHPTLDVRLTLPASLHDSEYSLELKLFKVGWVKSDKFRVDLR